MSLFDDIKSTPDAEELAWRATVMLLKRAGVYKIKFPSRYLSDNQIFKGFKHNSIQQLTDAIRKRSSFFLFDLKEFRNDFPVDLNDTVYTTLTTFVLKEAIRAVKSIDT